MKHYFLIAAAAILLCSCTGSNRTDGEGNVKVIVTDASRSYDLATEFVGFDKNVSKEGAIVLNPATRYQTMHGFGAAVTGSSCYNLMQMSAPDSEAFLKQTFSVEEGLGYSYVRIAIGCSDFSLSEYTCCDTPGIENFALTSEETEYVIPILKQILEINPDVKIMGSPWTPPKWMKVEDLVSLKPFDSWTSGQLNPAHYQDYGVYFVKWIEAMEAAGIPITSVTPQNEPLNRGNSASLFMGWEEELAFVRDALGPKLREAGLETKIYLFDHNYNYDNMVDQEDYPVKIYNDPIAAEFVAGAAYHNYGGVETELNDIHNQRPDKELVFTETSIGTWNDGRNLERHLIEDMEHTALGTINRWCQAVIVWNLMLDDKRGPNREGGCQTCYGAVDIESGDYKSITRNSHYYIIGHLSAVVRPGAVRIGTNGESQGILTSAYENPDGSYALVMLNKNVVPYSAVVSDGKNSFNYTVPALSVASFIW